MVSPHSELYEHLCQAPFCQGGAKVGSSTDGTRDIAETGGRSPLMGDLVTQFPRVTA